MSQQLVKPELISGTRDLLPQDAILLQTMTDTIRRVYESFGFVPLETPCLERWGVLTGNDPDFNKSLFRATIVKGAEDRQVNDTELATADAALRFDLTVALARVVSAYPHLPRPFKRYQIGRVFRGEPPQADRFREFTQFDFDIIGSSSIYSDVEVVQVIYATMQALGVPRFTIRFNTRRLLNGLAELVGCTAQAKHLFRTIDKVDRISVEGVLTELQREPDNQYDDAALALKGDQLARVREFLELRNVATTETLSRLSLLFAGDSSPSAAAGITEMTTMVELLHQLEIPENFWTLDLSVARGLDYYTGPVFETILDDKPSLGSVIAGGRFDGLTNRFIPDSNISGVGASVGVDRLINGLRDLKLLTGTNTVTQVLVTVFGPELRQQSLLFSQQLRLSGLNTELYLGEDPTLRAQMAYAAKQGIPFAVVIGPDEASQGVVQLKNMRQRSQELVSRDVCAEKIRSAL